MAAADILYEVMTLMVSCLNSLTKIKITYMILPRTYSNIRTGDERAS